MTAAVLAKGNYPALPICRLDMPLQAGLLDYPSLTDSARGAGTGIQNCECKVFDNEQIRAVKILHEILKDACKLAYNTKRCPLPDHETT